MTRNNARLVKHHQDFLSAKRAGAKKQQQQQQQQQQLQGNGGVAAAAATAVAPAAPAIPHVSEEQRAKLLWSAPGRAATSTSTTTTCAAAALELQRDATMRVEPTGVIHVMSCAQQAGFTYEDADWVNFGQGAPETSVIDNAPERPQSIEVGGWIDEYASVAGEQSLREAVARLYNERYRAGKASQYSAENVLIVPGGRAGLCRVAALFGRVPVGYFVPEYTAWGGLMTIFPRCVPVVTERCVERGFQVGAAELRQAVEAHDLRIVVNSNPCNPTGQLLEGDALRDYVEEGRRARCLLLMDEFYSSFIYDEENPGRTVSSAEYVDDVNADPVLILDGMTKNMRCPGWRVGWFVGPRDLIRQLRDVGSFMDGGANHPAQRASAKMLEPSFVRQDVLALQQHFNAKRLFMLRRLRELGLEVVVEPKATFYVWVRIASLPAPLNTAEAFFRAALAEKVIVVPGYFFGVHSSTSTSSKRQFNDYVRFSYGPPKQTLQLGLDRLEALLARARAGSPLPQ